MPDGFTSNFCGDCGRSSPSVRFASGSPNRCTGCTDINRVRKAESRFIHRNLFRDEPIVEPEPDHRDGFGRIRSPRHLLWLPPYAKVCIIPGCTKCRIIHGHHLTIAQPKAMQVRAGDNFVLNLGDWHHSELHDRCGDERDWWISYGLNPFPICHKLWMASPYGERLIPTTAADWLIVPASAALFPFKVAA